MKVSTYKVFIQRVTAPKGYKFDMDKVYNSGLFDVENMPEDCKPKTILSGYCLEWKEYDYNLSGEIQDDGFWNMYLGPCLVKIDG